MIDFLQQAKEMEQRIVADRRYLHQHAELGDDLPQTTAFIKCCLDEIGVDYEELIRGAVVANIGCGGGKTLLIRADIDALPQTEQSGEPFACTTGAAHSCGHDIHNACLLACARMLKGCESELNGNVKLVFQPDEERILGAVKLIEAGVLENPHVDAAIAMHTNLPLAAGAFNLLPGTYLSSSDIFKITVTGKGAHSSQPEKGVDPILTACKIIDAVQTITTRETDVLTPCVITFGSIHAGEAANIIPDTAELTGTIRAFDKEVREQVLSLFVDRVQAVAAAYRAAAEVEFTSSTPTTYNDPALSARVVAWLQELAGDARVSQRSLHVKGSDDFAYYCEKVPSVMYHVGMGTREDGYTEGLHNPKVRFDERALPYGAAAFAHIAVRWLEENA